MFNHSRYGSNPLKLAVYEINVPDLGTKTVQPYDSAGNYNGDFGFITPLEKQDANGLKTYLPLVDCNQTQIFFRNKFLSTFLYEKVFSRIFAVQSPAVRYRTLKMECFYGPIYTTTMGLTPLSNLTRYENYNFTCNSELQGGSTTPDLRVGGLSFSLYPDTSMKASTGSTSNSAINNKPGRVVINGCALDPKAPATSPEVKALLSLLKEPIEANTGTGLYLKPKTKNDVLDVRAVQYNGYRRVAGQRGKRPGSKSPEGGED